MNIRLLPLIAVCWQVAFGQTAPPNSTGVSMGHIHLVVRDVEAQRKLWIETLGGKQIVMGPVEYVKFPGVFVGLRRGESNGGTDGSIVNHLGFKVPDLQATLKKLTAAGGKVVREMPETRQAFVMFPEGVKVEFTEDNAQTRPIEHHHVHFFTDGVEKMRAWYAEHFGAVPGMRGKFQAADIPGANLTYSPSERTVPTVGRSVDHIGFEVKDLLAFCKKLEAAGLKLDTEPAYRPDIGISLAFLTDPWGTRIELTQGLNLQ